MLECVSAVKNSQGAWNPGDVVPGPLALEEWLLRDSPESWKKAGAKPAPAPEPEADTDPAPKAVTSSEDKAFPHRGRGRRPETK